MDREDPGPAVREAQAPGPPVRPVGPFLAGWRTAVVRALFAVLALGAVAEVVPLLGYLAENGSKPPAADLARVGGAIFYAFHRVGFAFDVPRSSLGDLGGEGFPFPIGASFTASVAVLGGTLLATALLYRGGRAVAAKAGGGALVRGGQGAKVAVPYAAVCLAAALGVRFTVPVGNGNLSIHPSYLQAAILPLGLGLLSGFVGGLRSAGDQDWPRGSPAAIRWVRRLRAAAAGGWWMLVLGLTLSFAGFLILAVLKPGATRAYFDGAFQGGGAAGAGALYSNLLVVPNMAAWTLFPSMGSCLGLSGGSFGLQGSICLLSHTRFPSRSSLSGFIGGGGVEGLPHPPPGYYAFILAPVIAVVAGGMITARRARVETRTEAVGTGALAGVAFGLIATLALLLSIVVVRVGGNVGAMSGSVTLRLGPELTRGMALAFAWGIAGGAIGGAVHGRGMRASAASQGPAPSDAERAAGPPPPAPSPGSPPATAPAPDRPIPGEPRPDRPHPRRPRAG